MAGKSNDKGSSSIRNILVTILIPVLTIIVSYITTTVTLRYSLEENKLDYTQDRITELLRDTNIVDRRNKLKFLVKSGLAEGVEDPEKLLASLDEVLVSEVQSIENFLKGIEVYNQAESIDGFTLDQNDKEQRKRLYQEAIIRFSETLELNPNNMEAKFLLAFSYSKLADHLQSTTLYELSIKHHEEFLGRIDYNLASDFDQRSCLGSLIDVASNYFALEKDSLACSTLNKVNALDSLVKFDDGYRDIWRTARKAGCKLDY